MVYRASTLCNRTTIFDKNNNQKHTYQIWQKKQQQKVKRINQEDERENSG
jgi:hypothetical protein